MTSPQSIIVVCAANLSSSSRCPLCCGKCWYGGRIPVQWSYRGQGYVQYFSSREAIGQEHDTLQYDYAHTTFAEKEKFIALKEWLLKHPEGSEEE